MIHKSIMCVSAICVAVLFAASASAVVIYESGTLGPTSISREDVNNQVVLGANINSAAYNGVRFYLSQPVLTTEVGGHFVGPPGSTASFFGAIVGLVDENDFPDSEDLSTSDVLGTTLLTFPEPSEDVFGNLEISLSPGWYALLFGSGLFGTTGDGAALLNNSDLETPSYIGYLNGFSWGSRPSGMRFVVKGAIVPEPPTATILLFFTTVIVATNSRKH